MPCIVPASSSAVSTNTMPDASPGYQCWYIRITCPPKEWPTSTSGRLSPASCVRECRSRAAASAHSGSGPESLQPRSARSYQHARVNAETPRWVGVQTYPGAVRALTKTTVGLPSPVQWMLSVRPPMSTERPTCFSTRRSRHAPMCSYKAAPSSTTATNTATSRAPVRANRYAPFQASLDTNVLSGKPDENASRRERGWPNHEDHRRPNRDGCCGCYPASGVDTPSLNPSRSVNWNMRAPHGRSAGSLSSAPPAVLIRAAAASTSALPATLICR